jgi:P27 family predicted phage terminase small subunit
MAGTSRSGRRPNPASIRELTGARTRPHHRGEPEYAVGEPSMPAHIEADAIAAEKWRTMAPRLVGVKVLTEAHGEMLALLCSSWADLVRAREELAVMNYTQFISEHRMTATGEEIVTKKLNPLFARIEKLSYQIARFLGEFGLTPMTSTKVAAKLGAGEDLDPLEDLMRGGNGGEH